MKLISKGEINIMGTPVECTVHLEKEEIAMAIKGENLYFYNDQEKIRPLLYKEAMKLQIKHKQ